MRTMRPIERGAMLLEVLVAFGIASSALVVIGPVIAHALRDLRMAGLELQAASHAESLLAAAEAGATPDLEERSGILDERFRWRLRTSAAGPEAPNVGGLVERTVSLEWKVGTRSHTFVLTTQRLTGGRR